MLAPLFGVFVVVVVVESERQLVPARLVGVFVVMVVVECAPAGAGAPVWCVRCCGGCRERQLVPARLLGVFVAVVVVE